MTGEEKIEELRREVYVLKAGMRALLNELQWRHSLDAWPIDETTRSARGVTLSGDFDLKDYNV